MRYWYTVASGTLRDEFSTKAQAVEWARKLSSTNQTTAYVWRVTRTGMELVASFDSGKRERLQ